MKEEKGITLIALVITIIVMLILVVVSVTVALDGGLFNSAKSARDNTTNEAEGEKEISTGTVNIDNKKVNIEEYANNLNVE